MNDLIIIPAAKGMVFLSNGIKHTELNAKEIGFSWKISNNTGRPEFEVRFRGKVMFVVNQELLKDRFDGVYENVNDAFERSRESLLESLNTKQNA